MVRNEFPGRREDYPGLVMLELESLDYARNPVMVLAGCKAGWARVESFYQNDFSDGGVRRKKKYLLR